MSYFRIILAVCLRRQTALDHLVSTLASTYSFRREVANILAAPQINYNLSLWRLLCQKPTDSMLNTLHTQPVPAVDERTSPLELRNEIPEVLSLASIVKLLHGPLGNNAAVIRIHNVFVVTLLLRICTLGRTAALRITVERDGRVVYLAVGIRSSSGSQRQFNYRHGPLSRLQRGG